jgi:tRNA pseudouridine38-40 synthase
MTNWKLTLAYDGAPYRGWQVQPNLPTVQGLLSDAIHRTTGERVLPQGSGRTDAGVHALAQVASFTLKAPIPAANLHRALNRCLPPSIRVFAVEAVPPDFHARHSALRKTYEYRIFPLEPNSASNCHSERSEESPHFDRTDDSTHDRICPPTLAPTVWPCPWPLDLAALNQAAAHVLGTHDFTSFAAADPDLTHRTMNEDCHSERSEESPHLSSCSPGAPSYPVSSDRVGYSRPARTALTTLDPDPSHSPVRTITHSQWRAADNLLLYRVTADGFLHHMVRNLVGTFVLAGAHRLSPDSIPTLLAARDRSIAGPTAPASGLFLVSVDYPAPPALSS